MRNRTPPVASALTESDNSKYSPLAKVNQDVSTLWRFAASLDVSP